MAESMTFIEYELLTRRLMQLITERAPVVTTRLEHDVTLEGHATSHQIDVLWEFTSPDGSPRRIIIECRKLKDRLKQQAALAWSMVVHGLTTPELPTTGVMATLTGYQSGAQKVADTYGVVILQLRAPNPADLQNRLTRIVVAPTVRMPYIGTDVNVVATETFTDAPQEPTSADEFGLLRTNSSTILLQDYLWAGVPGSFDEPPVAPQRITYTFDPPAVLTLRGEPLARITEVSATVGEVEWDTAAIVLSGGTLAWMITNILDGTRVWFTDTDRTHVTDDHSDGVTLATDVILGRPPAVIDLLGGAGQDQNHAGGAVEGVEHVHPDRWKSTRGRH